MLNISFTLNFISLSFICKNQIISNMTKYNFEKEIYWTKFNAALWDENIFEWKRKNLSKTRYLQFFTPEIFGSVLKKPDKQIRNKNAVIPDNTGISDHTLKLNMDIYIAVDKEIPGGQNTTMSGTFVSKFTKDHPVIPKSGTKISLRVAKLRDIKTDKIFMWFTTCPKCAKKYGKNYVVFWLKLKK